MPSLPTRTTDIQTYNGEKIVCAKFTTYEANTVFKIRRVAFSNGDFQFQMVVKSNENANIGIVLGGVEHSISSNPGFTFQKTAFSNLDVTESQDLLLIFPAGTFWLYHLQLEAASSPSDWRPAPEDSSDYSDDVGRETYDRATSYAELTAEQKAEAAVEAQTQASIFNKLTNNGQVQGIYLSGGKVYINASYIQTGTLSIKKGNLETFYANADTGEIRIVADEFSLSSGAVRTLSDAVNTSKSYTDEKKNALDRTIADMYDDFEALTAQQKTELERYADQSASQAVGGQTQQQIFAKLTNGSQQQGLYLSGGKIYINAEYIATGILADPNDNMAINLSTGKIFAKKLQIDSPYFKLTENGKITATQGSFDNIEVKGNCDLSPVSRQVIDNQESRIKEFAAEKITADYIKSKFAVLGALSARENGIGVAGGVYSSGTVSAPYIYASTRYDAVGGNGQTATISLKDPNGNTAASLGFSGGILISATGTYQFACTKTFKYSKAGANFWAYSSSTATTRTHYSFTYVSDISTSGGTYTITM